MSAQVVGNRAEPVCWLSGPQARTRSGDRGGGRRHDSQDPVLTLVHGCGHARVARPGCSDRPFCRRVRTWATEGRSQRIHILGLARYDQLIGPDLRYLGGDGFITIAPGFVRTAGRQRLSPASSLP
jgi:hypothetical protein